SARGRRSRPWTSRLVLPSLVHAPVRAPRVPLGPRARGALRAAGAAIGAFIALNLAGEAIRGPFDTLSDWVSLPDALWLRAPLTAAVAAALLANGLLRARPPLLRRAGWLLFAAIAAFAILDAC